MYRAKLIKYAEYLKAFMKGCEGSCQSRCEQTYLAAVRTLSKNNVEALPAGGQRSQPLKEKDRREKDYFIKSLPWI